MTEGKPAHMNLLIFSPPYYSVLLNPVLFEKLLCYHIDKQNERKEAFGIPAVSLYRLWDLAHGFERFLFKLLKHLFSAGDLYLRGDLAEDLCTEDIPLSWGRKEQGM